MRQRGPLLTLLAVVVLGAVLLAVNLSKAPAAAPDAPPDTAAEAAPPAAAPTEQPPAPVAAAEQLPAQANYVGRTEDGTALAVTVRDGKVSAYLCDGTAVESWYQGGVAGPSIEARGKGANAADTLTGTLDQGRLTGTVSAGGTRWSYTAAPVNAPAGLYRARTRDSTVGWIRDPNGQVTGLANRGGTVAPAPPLEGANAQYVVGE